MALVVKVPSASAGLKSTELWGSAGIAGAIVYVLDPMLSDPDRLVRAAACASIGLGLGLCSAGYALARGLKKMNEQRRAPPTAPEAKE